MFRLGHQNTRKWNCGRRNCDTSVNPLGHIKPFAPIPHPIYDVVGSGLPNAAED